MDDGSLAGFESLDELLQVRQRTDSSLQLMGSVHGPARSLRCLQHSVGMLNVCFACLSYTLQALVASTLLKWPATAMVTAR